LTLFGIAFSQYFSLRESSPALIRQWEIIEDQGGYVLSAKYSLNSSEGSYTFKSPCYLNEPAALMALKEKAKLPHLAWYDPNKPSISVLEKVFPFGYLIKILVSLSGLIYFLLLFKRLKFSFS
jgi:hypothetical protein